MNFVIEKLSASPYVFTQALEATLEHCLDGFES